MEIKNIADVRADILKYSDELEKHSHDELYCRMHLWAKVIRKSGIPLLRNSKEQPANIGCPPYCHKCHTFHSPESGCKEQPEQADSDKYFELLKDRKEQE